MQIIKRTAILKDVFVGEGVYELCLRNGEIEDLESLTNAGAEELYQRFTDGKWRIADIKNTVRLALQGGGMGQQDSWALVERCVKEGYLLEYGKIARAALMATLLGPEDEEIPKESPAENPPGSFPGTHSTSTEESLGSAPNPSDAPHTGKPSL